MGRGGFLDGRELHKGSIVAESVSPDAWLPRAKDFGDGLKKGFLEKESSSCVGHPELESRALPLMGFSSLTSEEELLVEAPLLRPSTAVASIQAKVVAQPAKLVSHYDELDFNSSEDEEMR